MSDKMIDIDPTGDLVIKVVNGVDRGRFRVSSLVLRLSSDVFATLLGPDFAEGQALASNPRHIEVSLKDDDVDCMRMIFEVIHFKYNFAMTKPAPETVFGMVKLVDKYLLQKSMGFALRTWLVPNKDADLYSILQAVIQLNLPDLYEETTRLISLHERGYPDARTMTGDERGVGFHRTMATIGRVRNDRKARLLRYLYALADDRSTQIEFCVPNDRTSEHYLHLIRQFDDQNASLRNLSLEYSCQTAADLLKTDTSGSTCHDCPNHWRHKYNDFVKMKNTFMEELQDIKEVKGLCLDCELGYRNEDGSSACKTHPAVA